MGNVIYSKNVLWVLLPSPAGIFMLILLAEGIHRFWQEFGLKGSQLTITNIFVRIYQLILGAGLVIAMYATYFVTGGYGVWQDKKVKNSKLNAPNIIYGCLILIISLALASSGVLTLLGGEHIMKARLADKTIYYGKSTVYYVHSSTGDQFHVSPNTYYQMQIGSCYIFSFYEARGVLTMFYSADLVTSIAQIAC